MSVDIDFFTLGRLTEKAFKFDSADKTEYLSKVSEILANSETPAEDVVKFIEQELLSRKILFAASTADPKAALKPKGMAFRRAEPTPPQAPQVLVEPVEITPEEASRRLLAAKEAHRRLVLSGAIVEDDEEDESEDISEEDMETLMKEQIMGSKMLEGKLEDE